MLCWYVALLVRYSAGPSTGLVAVSTSVHFLIRAIRSAACFAPRHPSPLPRPGICHCHHPMLPSLIALLMRVPLLVRLLVRPPSCPTPPPLRTGSVTLRPSHYVRSRPPPRCHARLGAPRLLLCWCVPLLVHVHSMPWIDWTESPRGHHPRSPSMGDGTGSARGRWTQPL